MGGGTTGLLVICATYAEQNRVWSKVYGLNKTLKNSDYHYVTRQQKGSYNVLITRVANPPQFFDYWDVGEA